MTQTAEFLTSSEVATEAGIDISTVNRDAKAGRIKAAKKVDGLRGPRLFTRDAVDAYLRDRIGEPAP